MAENTENILRVVTGKVRLSFPYLFEPRQPGEGQDGDPKYSVMLLIPKTDTKTIKALRAAEAKATENGKNTKFGGKTTGLAPSIIKDADEDGSAEDYPEREGHLYMTVSANQKFKPGVVDRNVQPILDQSEVYSGVFAKVSVTAFPYKFGDMKKGVSFGLNNVQILGGGDSLAGGKRATDEFEAVEADDEADNLL
jgi:hypothetical protein